MICLYTHLSNSVSAPSLPHHQFSISQFNHSEQFPHYLISASSHFITVQYLLHSCVFTLHLNSNPSASSSNFLRGSRTFFQENQFPHTHHNSPLRKVKPRWNLAWHIIIPTLFNLNCITFYTHHRHYFSHPHLNFHTA